MLPTIQDNGVLKICGRDAAVDYSITKEKYNAMKQGSPSALAAAAAGGDGNDNDEGGDGDEAGENERQGEEVDGMDVDSDEDDGGGGGGDDDDGSSDDEGEDDGDEGDQQREGGPDAGAGVGPASAPAPERQRRAPDVNHGCTVFVRNVAFDCAQEEIKEKFSEFGDVRLALLVKDRATGMPRGTAFVKVRAGRHAGSRGGRGDSSCLVPRAVTEWHTCISARVCCPFGLLVFCAGPSW